MSHVDVNLILGIINGLIGLWAAYAAKRNKKDIDGVALVVGTERAKDRVSKQTKEENK